jgi:hypothetical protein
LNFELKDSKKTKKDVKCTLLVIHCNAYRTYVKIFNG